jgi:hypothetical protein
MYSHIEAVRQLIASRELARTVMGALAEHDHCVFDGGKSEEARGAAVAS